MSLKLSPKQLQDVADNLFLMRSPAQAKLPRPQTTGPAAFTAALAPIAADPRFKDIGVGVVDVTNADGVHPPNVWLNNESRSWRIASTGKLAIMLAAVQLRDDVRRILDLGILSKPSDFDELFKMAPLWNLSKNQPGSFRVSRITEVPPRPSTIFDFDVLPVDFTGPIIQPDNQALKQSIHDRLPPDAALRELSWEKLPDFKFSERFWLMGAFSDNVAATSCLSEIGVPYMKGVERVYGLFDVSNGMHMLLSDGYSYHDLAGSPVAVDRAKPSGATYRPVTDQEYLDVEDMFSDKYTLKANVRKSRQPGSAAALTAYMIALLQHELVDPGQTSTRGDAGCRTIQDNLADGSQLSIASEIAGRIGTLPGTTITRQINKIGILQVSNGEEPPGITCEFVYMETKDAGTGKELKYAVVGTGIKEHGPDLGEAIHKALMTL